jgi:hypothetical protein
MPQVIDLERSRLTLAAKKGYRNWVHSFGEEFGLTTRLEEISTKTLAYLAQGKDKGTFYLYDLIMNLQNWGSGFEFEDLSPDRKMAVIDRYLFILDRIRFECMKRLAWLEGYPGEEYALVEFVTRFDQLAPMLQAKVPALNRSHSGYEEYASLNAFDQEAFVRKLIPQALKEIRN